MKKIVNKLRNLFSDERKEELKNDRTERKKKLSIAYQLGFYVGEEIVNRFLPTLSVDEIQTNVNISVTAAEGDECRRLRDLWFEKSTQDENESDVERKALRTKDGLQ